MADGSRRDGLRETGPEDGVRCHLPRLPVDLWGASDDDVVDGPHVDPVALGEVVQHGRQQVRRMPAGQYAALLASSDRCADGIDDNRVGSTGRRNGGV